MKIKVQARRLSLTKSLKAYVKRRLNFALNSRYDNIQRVTVMLTDVNGPKGGEDKHCQVLVKINGQKEVVINERQADMYYAIDSAATRTGRTVSRRIERLQAKATRMKAAFHKMRAPKKMPRDVYEEYENEYGYYRHA
ncbi:Sigma 54 modulation protein / S30EA ribosomal protein [Marinomonas spartinae]|uniref:Sigma 54 modulation protein / S30EA ribosomal protein n=1 Tax=Marinomonas spartinae TaxID=1792290 RepID=A0A1A8TF89_9GAMM|nr:HPF/RaiA family ribosome-associated protein [Marinomonas spartinae]SBS31994.1 Sigma 54 modulation protein / S30EA ribosomal protein [Marinomonas spartinae]SBS35667.1 Sigma 54 modulation protein / S30EA ribosomal protein [Marinomonas spartinae]